MYASSVGSHVHRLACSIRPSAHGDGPAVHISTPRTLLSHYLHLGDIAPLPIIIAILSGCTSVRCKIRPPCHAPLPCSFGQPSTAGGVTCENTRFGPRSQAFTANLYLTPTGHHSPVSDPTLSLRCSEGRQDKCQIRRAFVLCSSPSFCLYG